MSSPTPTPTNILILGLGELGTAILSALVTHPSFNPATATLTVLRRSAPSTPSTSLSSFLDPLPANLPPNIQSETKISFETADLSTAPIPELSAIFAKYDVVIQCTGYGFPRGTLTRIAEAVLNAGVKRFVPWQFGVDYDAVTNPAHAELVGEMRGVRKLLREQGKEGQGEGKTRWTVISTGLFMSFLFLREFGVVDVKERVVRALGGWDSQVTVTDVSGIGRMVAECVFEGRREETESRVVYVAGDTVTYREVAEIVEQGFGGEWRREEWDDEVLKRMLEERPGDLMARYQNMFGAGVGVTWEMERTLNYNRGIKLTGLKEYVEENREKLLQMAE